MPRGPADIPAPDTFAARLTSVIHARIGAVPKRERARVEMRMNATAREQLRAAMLAWAGADHLDGTAFRDRFLPASTNAKAADLLRAVTSTAEQARTYADLRDASELPGAAVAEVGAYRWPAFVAGAGQCAGDAAVTLVADHAPSAPGLPSSGEASTYSDFFVGKNTASGVRYQHDG